MAFVEASDRILEEASEPARRGPARVSGWLALCVASVIGHAEARAECTAQTPACHLANGKALLERDPRRAAAELLASFQLDERTDTLTLYAVALERDHRYALALDTWKRIITFRDSEVEAANEQQRRTSGRKRAAAVAAAAKAEKLSEEAAEAIIQLWPHIGKVRVRVAPGQQLAVTRDGAEVDVAQGVIINAGGDELVFTRGDGSIERVAVQVAPGATLKIDAPAGRAVKPERTVAHAEAPTRPERTELAREAPTKPARTELARAEAPTGPTRAEASTKPSRAEAPTRPARAEAPTKPAHAEAPTRSMRAEISEKSSPKSEPGPVLVATPKPVEPAPADPALVEPAPIHLAHREPDGLFTLSHVGLGLIAGGVLAGGVAGGFAYLSSRDFDRARSAGCTDSQCPIGPASDLAHQSNDRARIAQYTAIGAGVLAATGVTLWYFGHHKHHAVEELTLHVGPSSTALSGRF